MHVGLIGSATFFIKSNIAEKIYADPTVNNYVHPYLIIFVKFPQQITNLKKWGKLNILKYKVW